MKTFEINIGGKEFKVDIERFDGKSAAVTVNGKTFEINLKQAIQAFRPGGVTPPPSMGVRQPAPQTAPQPATVVQEPVSSVPKVAGSGQIVAPMPGLILDILVAVGDTVRAGAAVIKIEAMKMENEIPAPMDGTVKEIVVKKGDRVQTDEVLLVIA